MSAEPALNHQSESLDAESSPQTIGISNVTATSPQMDKRLLSSHTNDEINHIEYKLEGKQSRLKPKHFVYLCTSLACLSSILLGYDIGMIWYVMYRTISSQLHPHLYTFQIPHITTNILYATDRYNVRSYSLYGT